MPKSKEEQIFIQQNQTVIELTGKTKDEFIALRDADLAREKEIQKQFEIVKELKISAYKKLGLTDDEIAAIL